MSDPNGVDSHPSFFFNNRILDENGEEIPESLRRKLNTIERILELALQTADEAVEMIRQILGPI